MALLKPVEHAARRLARAILPSSMRQDIIARLLGGNRVPIKDVFSSIYRDKVWGGGGEFNSGFGSHDPAVTEPYVAAISEFLGNLASKPVIVDLGCGDFAIGSQLVGLSQRYVGCDIVQELIEYNKKTFVSDNLTFQTVNIASDSLPTGDVAFIRQVLQHLSNAHISAILPKLKQFQYLVVTEDLPTVAFLPNRDKPTGAGTRGDWKSGVVLDNPPFSLKCSSKRVLCSVIHGHRHIETTLFTDPHL